MIKIQKTSCNTSCKTSHWGLEKLVKSEVKEAGF